MTILLDSEYVREQAGKIVKNIGGKIRGSRGSEEIVCRRKILWKNVMLYGDLQTKILKKRLRKRHFL